MDLLAKLSAAAASAFGVLNECVLWASARPSDGLNAKKFLRAYGLDSAPSGFAVESLWAIVALIGAFVLTCEFYNRFVRSLYSARA